MEFKNTFVYREQVELCVDILERVLGALSPVCLVQTYRSELQAGLTHPNDTVKILALTQVSFTHNQCPHKKKPHRLSSFYH